MSHSSAPGSLDPFSISRTFDASRDRLWKAWTDRDCLLQWFGPRGFTMTIATFEFRPGGLLHYAVRSPDGKEMWGKFVYREIEPSNRILLINSFSDPAGGITRHPFSPTWPLEMITTSVFTEEAGKATLTLHSSPLNASPEEEQTFNAARAGMVQGWTGTFDQLAAYLALSR